MAAVSNKVVVIEEVVVTRGNRNNSNGRSNVASQRLPNNCTMLCPIQVADERKIGNFFEEGVLQRIGKAFILIQRQSANQPVKTENKSLINTIHLNNRYFTFGIRV